MLGFSNGRMQIATQLCDLAETCAPAATSGCSDWCKRRNVNVANENVDSCILEGATKFENAVDDFFQAFETALRWPVASTRFMRFSTCCRRLSGLMRKTETRHCVMKKPCACSVRRGDINATPCSGLLAVFYHDAVASVQTSILTTLLVCHRAVVAGAAAGHNLEEGTLKTPGWSQMLPLLQASVNKLPHFAPGRQANAFHVVEPRPVLQL